MSERPYNIYIGVLRLLVFEVVAVGKVGLDNQR